MSSSENQTFSSFHDFEKEKLTDSFYWKQYFQVLWVGLLFLLLLGVLTYDPSDDSFLTFTSGNHEYLNVLGFVGANLSEFLYTVFGLPALIFATMFLFLQLAAFRVPKPHSRWLLRLFGFPQFILFYCVLFHAIRPTLHWRGVDMATGGFLGSHVFQFLKTYLGQTGSLLFATLGAFSSLTLCFGIRPISTVSFLLSLLSFGKLQEFEKKIAEPNDDLLQKNEASVVVLPQQNTPVLEKKNETQVASSPKNILSLGQKISHNDFLTLLSFFDCAPKGQTYQKSQEEIQGVLDEEAHIIQEKLLSFDLCGNVVSSQAGPVVHIHEFEPSPGVKVNKILSLQDDLMLALKAKSLMMSLYGGKNTITIEVPSQSRSLITLREIMESQEFQNEESILNIALGRGADGSLMIFDLFAMPHLLIAGATGSGKSVCVNSILLSLMISKTPAELKLLLIDPKLLELSGYDEIGHLLMPVVTDPIEASCALKYLTLEMDKRYTLMKDHQVRNLPAYNQRMQENGGETLPHIVVVVDELSDLMMMAPRDMEESIQRLAQKARAAGIHLILATQRPSVNVLTGVIKANLPCRISFQVSSRFDSRTILETQGAERLLGKGDMLFLNPETRKLLRGQGAFVSDREISTLSDRLRSLYEVQYHYGMVQEVRRLSMDWKIRDKKPALREMTEEISTDTEMEGS